MAFMSYSPSFEAGHPISPPMPAPGVIFPTHASSVSASTSYSNHSVSQVDNVFQLPSNYVSPFHRGLLLPADGFNGSPPYTSGQPSGFFGKPWLSAPWLECTLVTPPLCHTAGYEHSPINVPVTPSFGFHLGALDEPMPNGVQFLHPALHPRSLPSPSSSSPPITRYHPFVDVDGVKKFQCMLCPKRMPCIFI